jgi:hypothetical protein
MMVLKNVACLSQALTTEPLRAKAFQVPVSRSEACGYPSLEAET